MNKTTESVTDINDRICVTITELCSLLSCGRKTANDIAEKAGARIYVGKRVLFSVEKIKQFVNQESF